MQSRFPIVSPDFYTFFQLLQWAKKVGDETISSLSLLVRASGDSTSVKGVANRFDEFFFIAWVSSNTLQFKHNFCVVCLS